MNPDRNRGGMTVNALLLAQLAASTVISVLAIAIIGVVATPQIKDGNTTGFVLVVIVCAIVALIGAIVSYYVIQRKIKDRILGLVDVCRNYIGGDRTVRASVNGDDEFATLSTNLNTLLDGQGSQGSAAFTSSGSSDAAALQAQIEKLLQEVSAVGDGDLRVQAEVTPDTLGVLADSFNYMIEELAKVVGRVQSTAVQVTNATRRILDGSAELAHASETQVRQIAQTTEAVEALAIFIQNVARNAMLSAEAAQDALRNANSGQQSVRQTIEGMMVIRENVQETSKKIKRLGERSNEIGEIVRIIEDIADQTNLLALNAAIQSAMAGEHGRGFAVVADEIRLLAERSTESTKRIATLVKSIQGDTYEAVVAMEDSTQEVVKGSQLADEAGRSLNSIYSAVERQAQMIESIARAANEQTTVSEAVAAAMGQISDITRQTNSGTQEAAASVSYLAELSDQLRSSVATFRLPDRGASDGSRSLAGMTSVTELGGGNGNQFFTPALGSGIDQEWGQNFSGNFPPLPEPGNSDALVALSAQSGQFNFNNQDFMAQGSFDGNQFGQFGSQQGFSGNEFGQYGSQQGFSGNDFGQAEFGQFGSQQHFGSQPFGNPASFNEFGNPGNFNEFENQQPFGGQQQFDNMANPGNSGQPFYPNPNMRPNSQPLNSGSLPPSSHSGRVQPSRPNGQSNANNWQNGQQNPDSSPFNSELPPFPTNGTGRTGQFGS
ncbi:MAG: methyl-accepting chemotaxis protein [Chloroflexota bacterium]|nr:methyl-accepting chemotaxis protein [Chloroflexota bacterium]